MTILEQRYEARLRWVGLSELPLVELEPVSVPEIRDMPSQWDPKDAQMHRDSLLYILLASSFLWDH